MSKLFDHALSQVPDDVKRFVDSSIEVANQIHAILERQGKTQRDLANLLCKNESEISKWLTGTHNFTLKSLSKIASVLDEKIITTPLESEAFHKKSEKAIKLFEIHSSGYTTVTKMEFEKFFSQLARTKNTQEKPGDNKDSNEIKEHLYAMSA